MPQMIHTFDLHFDEDHALALAQFVKRLRWEHIRECAVDEDEAYLIRDSIEKLEASLAAGGFKPR